MVLHARLRRSWNPDLVLNYLNLAGTYENPRRVPENLSWVYLALALRSYHTKPPSTLGEGRCDQISKFLSVPAAEIATIGDMQNDLLMLRKSGFSIAVGNAGPDVKKEAQAVTDSYNDEGFAKAMERFILNPAPAEDAR